MTETQYKAIWNDTNKAIKYLHNKGCMTLCDSVPSGFGVACLITCKASDTTEKIQAHIKKQYPLAMVEYTDRKTVVYGELERQKAFAEYRMNL